MSTTPDPITVEVVQGSFITTVRNMRATLIRTSFAPILYDTRDLSCALLSPTGELVAMSEGDFSGHVFSLQVGLTPILQKFGGRMKPGDVYMFNDPYTGGTHLNDIAFYKPHFIDGEIILFETVRAHWSDVGGANPGSFSGQDTEIYQEGVRIPPVKLVNQGELNQDLWDILFANVRIADEQEGNALAMLDSVRVGDAQINELCDKYGTDVVELCRDTLLDRAEQTLKDEIKKLEPGEYYVEHYCDSTGITPDPVALRIRMTVKDDTLSFDFTGSADEFEGPMNIGPAVTQAGAFVVVKAWLDPDTPVNGGTFRPIDFILPEGSVVNCNPPRAVAGVWELYRKIQSAVSGIFSQVQAENAGGGAMETINHIYITSYDPVAARHHILYEYPQGGFPATSRSDGTTGSPSYDGGDVPSIYPVESSEQRQPLRIESTEVTCDGEGAGEFRSGFGITQRIRVLSDNSQLNVMSDASVIPHWGVAGAAEGGFNACGVIRNGKSVEPSSLPGKVRSFPLQRDDLVIMRATAGGGVGDPLQRDPERVLQDVSLKYVSEARARDVYGVIVKNGGIDTAATENRRKELAATRETIKISLAKEDVYDHRGCRLTSLNPADAKRLNLKEDDMLEFVPAIGAPLRSWVKISKSVKAGTVDLGPLAQLALKFDDADEMRIRALKTAPDISHYNARKDYPELLSNLG
ncbi:MAG: hypothetical protein GKR93_00400 [Gammaproteobacteria bacterium]|nr:hypothetical protein [Gammaproteobacteria bacterium]